MLIQEYKKLRPFQDRLQAACGKCPQCGGVMTVDLECQITDPPHDGEPRVGPAALCNSCECCVEL